MERWEPLIHQLIEWQYQTNCFKDATELHPCRLQLQLDQLVAAQLYQQREQFLQVYRREESSRLLCSVLSDRAKRMIQQVHQFIHMTKQDERRLQSLYRQFIRAILHELERGDSVQHFGERMKLVINDHADRLKNFLIHQVQDHAIIPENPDQVVVCHEYTPTLQLRVLGIDLSALREPVLDIGCGSQGRLVSYLRHAGIEAYGVDRHIDDQGNPYLLTGDWLELTHVVPLGQQDWGTILSHMAFSNHFIHHHLRIDGRSDQYARVYMALLASLRKGGSFHYAPGLPFIEELLPVDQYQTRRHHFGHPDYYASQIVRLT